MKNIFLFLSVAFVFISCAQVPVAEEPKAQPIDTKPNPAAEKKDDSKTDGLAFGGHGVLAFQNWSRVGMKSDSKIGYGMGGSLGIGYHFGDTKFLVGPQLWYNKWQQNYSTKSQSATSSVYVAMSDAGLAFMADFDDVFIEIGGGSAGIKSAMTVNGKEIAYAYDGESFSYTALNLGVKMKPFLVGIGLKNYSGLAKYANHINFMFGLGF